MLVLKKSQYQQLFLMCFLDYERDESHKTSQSHRAVKSFKGISQGGDVTKDQKDLNKGIVLLQILINPLN